MTFPWVGTPRFAVRGEMLRMVPVWRSQAAFFLVNRMHRASRSVRPMPDSQGALPFITTYAVLYNVIPLVRWFLLRRRNERIWQRNSFRSDWAARALGGGQWMDRKLKATRSMKRAVK